MSVVVGATAASAVPTSRRYALPARSRRGSTNATKTRAASIFQDGGGGLLFPTAPKAPSTTRFGLLRSRRRVANNANNTSRRTSVKVNAVATGGGGGGGKTKLRGVRDKDGLSSGHRGAALEQWMASKDGFDGCGIKVRWLGPEKGYGGVATTRTVQEGDFMVRVPRSAMITAEEARFCRNVGRAARKLTEWQALTLKLVFERDRYASLSGRRDEWIEMLPDIDIMREMHPLMWPAEKRREMLKGSPTLAKLETMVEQCAEDRVTILRALGVDTSGPYMATAWPSQDEVLWAGAVIYSRAFQLSSKYEPMASFEGDGSGDGSGEEEEEKKEEVIGEQSMVQRGALWWSVEENLYEDQWDDVDPDDEREGAWGDFDSEDEDDIFEDENIRVYVNNDDSVDYYSGTIDDSVDGDSVDSANFYEHDGVFLALVPWADALNHDVYAGSKAVLKFNARTGFAEMRASSTFPVGAEVYCSYEPGISRQDQLLNYGFVSHATPPDDGAPPAVATFAAAAAASGVEEQEEDEDDIYGEGDIVDLPADEFW